jgi:hypothetical protein
VSGQFHAQSALTTRAPQYPLDRGLGGTHSQAVCWGEEENSVLLGVELRASSSNPSPRFVIKDGKC